MAAEGRVSIAVMALGGQGGGVLTEWIVETLSHAGYRVQSTSVPGVAQRTGATIYYVEATPEQAARGRDPVLALMPVPGDVDVVIAAEWMEAGRAMVRGFVTPDRTTLIASTSRMYAISEKGAMSDGRADADAVRKAAEKSAKRLIAFDLQASADAVGGVISAPLFGALAGSGALPIDRAAFEETIRRGGVAVEANLAGFAAGFDGAVSPPDDSRNRTAQNAEPSSTPLGRRITERFPAPVREIAMEGARRCADYLDRRYAENYVARLEGVLASDQSAENAVTLETAKRLALWMCYEDAIRVADLKTRSGRFARVRDEARVKADQIVHISEFMHPRVQEICDILPAPLGRFILKSRWASRILSFFFGHGRRVATSKLRGFLQLYALSQLRPLRRTSMRFHDEQARIGAWLDAIKATSQDPALAKEIAACQRLVKGYGDTFERGLRNYQAVMNALPQIKAHETPAGALADLRRAALKDEHGDALQSALDAMALRKEAA